MADKSSGEFEAAIKRLEEIVAQLDRGDVDLDRSVTLFREGIALSRKCQELLDGAQRQIDEALKSQEPAAPTPDDEIF